MLVCSILHTSIVDSDIGHTSIELANIAHTGIAHTNIMHTDTVHTNMVYTSIEGEGFCRGVFTAEVNWGNLDFNYSYFFLPWPPLLHIIYPIINERRIKVMVRSNKYKFPPEFRE